jgi:hypothetical protein
MPDTEMTQKDQIENELQKISKLTLSSASISLFWNMYPEGEGESILFSGNR